MGDWCWPISQPVVEPDGEQRRSSDVFLDLANRAGFGADYNMALNAYLTLEAPNRLAPDRRYTYEEVCDADLKNVFGPDRGIDWFKEHGVMKWSKKPEEVYWRPFTDVRVPIYWEWMTGLYEKQMAIIEPRGLSVPEEYFAPLPDWLPCPSHRCTDGDFDLYAFYYRDIIHTNGFTMENAWLDEAAQTDPFSYTIAINTDSAKARGIADGTMVEVKSETGRMIKGKVRLTEAIHPEGLGIAGCAGHWGNGMPLAKGKGVFFNELLELDRNHASLVNLNLDLCVKVRMATTEGKK